MLLIDMLDDDGQVTETVDRVHECTGDFHECETPAVCEDCGRYASQDCPVYVWTTPTTDMTYWACASCLAVDDYARLRQEKGPRA